MSDEPDDLSELLAPPPAAESPGLRDTILRQTQRRVAFRKWSRRAGQLAAVAAVFVVGIGVGSWFAPGASPTQETIVRKETVPEVVVVPVPVLVPVSGGPSEPPPPVAARTAKALELDAEQADAPAMAAVFYRQAGDAYLGAEQDYANAARCYRLFLARGGSTALAPQPGDSWLLTSLKNAAFKEKLDATPTGG